MNLSGRAIFGIAGLCLIVTSAVAAQYPPRSRRIRRGQGSGHIVIAQTPRANRASFQSAPPVVNVDPQALELLKKVFHRTQDYVGVQRTQQGAQSSEQNIAEDTRGRMRLEYIEPPAFQGDIVLSLPNSFYNYHARQNRIDVAYWPVSKEIKELGVITMIRNGRVTLAITGQETVAGRDCAILTLSWPHARGPAETQRRLWVDMASGIVMRREQWNATGQISASYMTQIKVGPDAGVTLGTFDPATLPKGAKQEPLFPMGRPPVANVAQAAALAGFHIAEPTQMPANYTIDGIWVFGRGRNTSVLLRYTVGVNHYSLFERPALNVKPAQLNRPYRHSAAQIQRWFIPLPGGSLIHVLYIGHLTADEVQAIHDSMR